MPKTELATLGNQKSSALTSGCLLRLAQWNSKKHNTVRIQNSGEKRLSSKLPATAPIPVCLCKLTSLTMFGTNRAIEIAPITHNASLKYLMSSSSLLHYSPLHNKIHLLQHHHVLQRIPRHRHNVRVLADLNRPDLILHPE